MDSEEVIVKMHDGQLIQCVAFEECRTLNSLSSDDVDVFRIRCEADRWIRFRQFLSEISYIHAAVLETPRNENPHVHALISTNKSEDALKRARTRKFKDDESMKGNAVASISLCLQPTEYLQYLFKGRYTVKDKGVYRKADPPNHNIVEILENYSGYDAAELYRAFWLRHKSPLTKTQYKKRQNWTEEVVADVAKQYQLVEYRYIDNYSKAILKESEDYCHGWDYYEMQDIRQTYRQVSLRQVTKYVIDKFCHSTRQFDDFIISKIITLITFKYRHHFVHLMNQIKERVGSIMTRAGFQESESFEQELN